MTGAGSVTRKPMHADELLASPRYRRRHELESGVLVAREPTGDLHGVVVIKIGHLLLSYAERARLAMSVLGGEPGFVLARDPDTVRAPDLAVLLGERARRAGTYGGFVPGAPDLAIEVRSPRDTSVHQLDRAGMWLAAGASEVWLVDPGERRVLVVSRVRASRSLGEGDSLEGEPLLAGLEIAVNSLFP